MDPRPTVMRGIELTPEVLEQQGRTLRALARSLLGDAAAAEDVVQETWLACLRHPGRIPDRLSAWGATVARQLAFRRLRSEGRRSAREAHAAAPERIEALQQLTLEREEALRAVTQALLALEEPYRGTLILRYYEDRTPGEIAAALGIPCATVKSRLARGLGRLRARLAAELGETRRQRALLVLAGTRGIGPALAATSAAKAGSLAGLGGLLLGLKLELAAVATLLAGSGLFLWNQGPGRPVVLQERRAALGTIEPEGTPSTDGSRPEAGAQAPAGVERRVAVTGASPAQEDAPLLAPETAFRFRIAGRLRDERDLPLAGASVFLGPRGFPLNRAAETDEEGRFALELTGRQPTLALVFSAAAEERFLGLRELALVSGQELALDLCLADSAAQGERLLPGVELEFANDFTEPLDQAPEILLDGQGRCLFVAQLECGGCPRPVPPRDIDWALLVSSIRVVQRPPLLEFLEGTSTLHPIGPIDLPLLRQQLQWGIFLETPRPTQPDPTPPTTIHGIVRDASGEPVSGVEVGWGVPERDFEDSVRTDEHGAYQLTVAPGESRVRAGGGDDGLASLSVVFGEGEDLLWNPVLERGAEVRGRVVLPSGAGLPGLRVELWSAQRGFLWSDSTLTGPEGRFAFPNAIAGPLELFITACGSSQPPQTFPLRVIHGVFAGTDLGDVLLGVDERPGALALRVVDESGESLEDVTVRIWQGSSGQGRFAAQEDGRWILAGMPPGPYSVEIGSPRGGRELGTVWVRGSADEPVDLGELGPEPPGLLDLALECEDGALSERTRIALWSARADLFVRVREWDAAAPTLLLVPPGDYVLCAAAGARDRAETPLTLESRSTRDLTLEISAELGPRFREGARGDSARETQDPEERARLRTAECRACHGDPDR